MLVLLVVGLVQVTLGSIVRTGWCPENVRGVANFNRTAYLGRWYEHSNVFEWYQDLTVVGARCVRATYTDLGERVGVLNEYVSTITGYGYIQGSASLVPDPDYSLDAGELYVSFAPGRKRRSLFGTSSQPRRANYIVASTDYTTYVVVYSCNPLFSVNQHPYKPLLSGLRKESLWLLTREQLPSEATIEKAMSFMKEKKLPWTSLVETQQTGCIYGVTTKPVICFGCFGV